MAIDSLIRDFEHEVVDVVVAERNVNTYLDFVIAISENVNVI